MADAAIKQRKHGFLIGLAVYVLLVLTAAAAGLYWFHGFLTAYEASRPQTAVNAYMASLTGDHVADLSQALISRIDHNVQPIEDCRAVIRDALGENFRFAKNSKKSNQTQQVYVVSSGDTVIGSFTIAPQAADQYGFTPWAVTEETFDMSYLVGSPVTKTIPADFTLTVNGRALDGSYVTVDNIHYPEIEEYYDDYDLPYRVTYEAGPFLGDPDVTVTNQQGDPVEIDESTELTQFFHNCTEEEARALDALTADFVARYIAFAGSSRTTSRGAFDALMTCVVPESDFAVRMRSALDGLKFGQSRHDALVSVTTHHQVRLAEGRFLCDVTWEVDTTGKKGVVRTQSSARLIVVETEDGYKVESMTNY